MDGIPTPPRNPLNLAQFRQKKGISLNQISQSTKIGVRFLAAIEAEEFEKLPGGIFNTSYLRQYAAATGYDEEELLEHYYLATGQEPTPAATQSLPNETNRWMKIPATVAGLFSGSRQFAGTTHPK